jgi:hypothetical protein
VLDVITDYGESLLAFVGGWVGWPDPAFLQPLVGEAPGPCPLERGFKTLSPGSGAVHVFFCVIIHARLLLLFPSPCIAYCNVRILHRCTHPSKLLLKCTHPS